MSWEIFFAINLVFATLREFTYKKISDKIDPFVVLFITNLLVGAWLTLSYIIIYKSTPPIFPVVSLGGVFYIFAFVYYLKAVSYSLSQSMLYSSYAILITIFLSAIFLGESKYFDLTTIVGLKVASGIILAFISLWLLLHTERKSEEKLERKWLFYIAVATACFGVGSFFSLFFLKITSPLLMVINQIYLEIPLSFALLIFLKKTFSLDNKKKKMLILNSVFISIAMMSFYYALVLVPAAKFYPLQQVALVIITMILGMFFFGEAKNLSGRKLIGMVLGFFGMALLITV